jgi:hypothetical protein
MSTMPEELHNLPPFKLLGISRVTALFGSDLLAIHTGVIGTG